jgi:hypothetical protein
MTFYTGFQFTVEAQQKPLYPAFCLYVDACEAQNV